MRHGASGTQIMKSSGFSNKLLWLLPIMLAFLVGMTGWWAN